MEFKRLIDSILPKVPKKPEGNVSQLMELNRLSDEEKKSERYKQIEREMMQIEKDVANGWPSAMETFMIDMKDHFDHKYFNSAELRTYVFGRYDTVVSVLLTAPRHVFPTFWLDHGPPWIQVDTIGVICDHFYEVMYKYHPLTPGNVLPAMPDLRAEMMIDHKVFSLLLDIVRSGNPRAHKGEVLFALELFMEDQFCKGYLMDSGTMTLALMHELRIALAEYPDTSYDAIYGRILDIMEQ